MELTWVQNNFRCKELYMPFVIKKDVEYYSDLKEKFNLIILCAKKSGADMMSVEILRKYRYKILEALKYYYRADIARCNTIIKNLIKDIGDNSLALSTLDSSDAFPGLHGEELQLFRSRNGNPSSGYTAHDMSYRPEELRAKSGNYRFSIPGNPSWYLANSSYGCWIESGYPSDDMFNVSPVLLDGNLMIFNLVISIGDDLNDYEEDRVHCWLKLLMLTIATSYRIKEEGRIFKSEYIISQAIMMACMKLNYDGVAYYSKRVSDEAFSICAINLALFVRYRSISSKLDDHIKLGDPFNYSIFKKLLPSCTYERYHLRLLDDPRINNIGNYHRQFPYRETEFYEFDQFLFSTWIREQIFEENVHKKQSRDTSS